VSCEASTTTAAVPLTDPDLAVMVDCPADWPVARPKLETVATLVFEELQVTVPVIIWVLPSLNVPVATYCCVVEGASAAVAGVTAIDFKVTELTFNAAEPVTPFWLALIFAVPCATAVAWPATPTVATDVLSDAQVTLLLITCVLPSLKVPVAVNCTCVPGAIVSPAGVTEMEERVALVTVSTVVALNEPKDAPMFEDPAALPFASPVVAPMVATVVSSEVQVACVVKFRVLPLVKVPMAENCSSVVSAMVGFAG
jgi:hypothetical protein